MITNKVGAQGRPKTAESTPSGTAPQASPVRQRRHATLPSPHSYIYRIVREVPGRQHEVQLMRGGPTKGTPKTAIFTILAFQFVREPTAFTLSFFLLKVAPLLVDLSL